MGSASRTRMARTTCHGTRDQPSLRLLTLLTHQRDHQTSHSDSHSRMFTRSVVLVPSQSDVSRPVSSRLVWSAASPHQDTPLKSSPLRCITKSSTPPSQVTTLVSTSRVSPSRTSREDTSPPTLRTTQLPTLRCSSPRLLSLTIQVRSTTVTPPSLIAIPPILPASSPRSDPRSTSVMVRSLKRNHNSSNHRKPPWLSSSHRSPWLSKLSAPTPHLVDSPLET